MLFKALMRGSIRPRQALRCSMGGCEDATREGKPYCPNHVEHNDYVRDILSKLEEKENEEIRVRSKGDKAIKDESLTLKEIVQDLKFHGPRTFARLSRDTQLDKAVLSGYIQRLVKEGRVETSTTNRGSQTVRLLSSQRIQKVRMATSSSRLKKSTSRRLTSISGRNRTISSCNSPQRGRVMP